MTYPTPPPLLEESAPTVQRGYPFVWFGVFALLVFMALAAYANLSDPGPVVEERAQIDRELRKLEVEFAISSAKHSGDTQKAAQEIVKMAESTLQGVHLKTKGAAYVRDRAILVLRIVAEPDKVHKCDFLTAATDDITDSELREETKKHREEINRAIRALAVKAPRNELEIALKILEKNHEPWPLSLALSETERRLGLDKSEGAPLWVGFLILGGLAIGSVLWFVYIGMRADGYFKPAGLTVRNIYQQNLVADSLGVRFFAFLAIFSAAPLGILFLTRLLTPDKALARIMATALVAPIVLFVVALPFLGVRIPFTGLIGLRPNVLSKVAWGVAGWLANVPALLVLIIVTLFLSRWLPNASHPLETELDSLSGVLWAAVAAGIIAPIVEEITFRGCLFQGLTIRLRSPVLAAIISSLAFASLHPQGPASWLALGWIGVMGCFLTYQTGSVVPAIVMHSLHNLSIVLLTALTKNSFGL